MHHIMPVASVGMVRQKTFQIDDVVLMVLVMGSAEEASMNSLPSIKGRVGTRCFSRLQMTVWTSDLLRQVYPYVSWPLAFGTPYLSVQSCL